MKRKGCPLLIQQDTNPSMTITGQSWTRSYMLECLGEKCSAYKLCDGKGICMKFETLVDEESDNIGD